MCIVSGIGEAVAESYARGGTHAVVFEVSVTPEKESAPHPVLVAVGEGKGVGVEHVTVNPLQVQFAFPLVGDGNGVGVEQVNVTLLNEQLAFALVGVGTAIAGVGPALGEQAARPEHTRLVKSTGVGYGVGQLYAIAPLEYVIQFPGGVSPRVCTPAVMDEVTGGDAVALRTQSEL
jgi:hypothetical protein